MAQVATIAPNFFKWRHFLSRLAHRDSVVHTPQTLSLAVGNRSSGQLSSFAFDCLVVSRRDKRRNGDSKSHFAHRTQWSHRC